MGGASWGGLCVCVFGFVVWEFGDVEGVALGGSGGSVGFNFVTSSFIEFFYFSI